MSAASAADLPAFTESGDYDVVLRVTRENATLDIPVWVRICLLYTSLRSTMLK